jgi:hypothetical protein
MDLGCYSGPRHQDLLFVRRLLPFPLHQLNCYVGSNQAAATKVSSLSITSVNPATIRICIAADIREHRVPSTYREHRDGKKVEKIFVAVHFSEEFDSAEGLRRFCVAARSLSVGVCYFFTLAGCQDGEKHGVEFELMKDEVAGSSHQGSPFLGYRGLVPKIHNPTHTSLTSSHLLRGSSESFFRLAWSDSRRTFFRGGLPSLRP